MGIITAISNAFGAVMNLFGWAKQRDAEKNSPAEQAAAAAKQLQAQEDQITQDVASGDLGAIRKDDSAK